MKKVADLDGAFLWSCRTFNKALSDTFHNWGPLMCRLSQWPQGRMCRCVHTCTCPTWPCLCICLYHSCRKAGELPKFNSTFTFGFRWVFWDATGGLPFGVWQTWKRYIHHNLNSMLVSSFSPAWNFKYDKILKTSREELLPPRQQDSFCRILHTSYRFLSISRSVPKVFLPG